MRRRRGTGGKPMTVRISMAALVFVVVGAAREACAQPGMAVGGGPTITLDPRNPNRMPPAAFPFAPASAYQQRTNDRLGFAMTNPWQFTPGGMVMTPYAGAAMVAATTVTPYSSPMSNMDYYDPYAMSATSPMNATLSKNRAFDPNAAATLNGLNAPSRSTSKAKTSRKSTRKKK